MEKQFQSPTISKLADALAKAQSEMQHASKGSENPFFKSKYADLPSVIDAARPSLSKHGLSVVQLMDYSGDDVSIITQMTHSSGEWMRSYYPVKPMKKDPQGYGSAVTYARRYAYQSIAGIASSTDDDDGNAASQKPKSPFRAAAARNTYTENVIKAFKGAGDVDGLNSIRRLNGEKLAAMNNSDSEPDTLAVEEMGKQYELCKSALEAPEDVPPYIEEEARASGLLPKEGV